MDDSDAFPQDPLEWLDTDGDGVGNNADSDDDNDGVKDSDDEAPLNPDIGPTDYTWLVLPITLAVLTVLALVGLWFIQRKKPLPEEERESVRPISKDGISAKQSNVVTGKAKPFETQKSGPVTKGVSSTQDWPLDPPTPPEVEDPFEQKPS